MKRHSSLKLVRVDYTELIWEGVSRYYKTSHYCSKEDGTIEEEEITKETYEKNRLKTNNTTKIYDVEEDFLIINKFLLGKFLSEERDLKEQIAIRIIMKSVESVEVLRKNVKTKLDQEIEYAVFKNVMDIKNRQYEKTKLIEVI